MHIWLLRGLLSLGVQRISGTLSDSCGCAGCYSYLRMLGFGGGAVPKPCCWEDVTARSWRSHPAPVHGVLLLQSVGLGGFSHLLPGRQTHRAGAPALQASPLRFLCLGLELGGGPCPDEGRSLVRAGLPEATRQHSGLCGFPSRRILCTCCDRALTLVFSAERTAVTTPICESFQGVRKLTRVKDTGGRDVALSGGVVREGLPPSSRVAEVEQRVLGEEVMVRAKARVQLKQALLLSPPSLCPRPSSLACWSCGLPDI